MKNILILCLICISCTKEVQWASPTSKQTTTSTPTLSLAHIGDPNRTPNLYLPEHEKGWLWDSTYFGLWSNYKRLEAKDTGVVLAYDCVIANGIKNYDGPFPFDYSSSKDFVVCRSCDGILDQYSGDYSFPGMLKLTLFKNGEMVGGRIKQQFFVEDNRERVGADWSKIRLYGDDTMSVSWGMGDNYFNKIQIPSKGGIPNTGKYVVKVEVNPDGAITESNYTDNIGLLPVFIQGMMVVTDTTAIAENKPKQITDLKGVYNGRGPTKTITLTWTSLSEEFCLERDGVMIKHIYANPSGHQSCIDTVSGNWKQGVYALLAENEGIGSTLSLPTTVRK